MRKKKEEDPWDRVKTIAFLCLLVSSGFIAPLLPRIWEWLRAVFHF